MKVTFFLLYQVETTVTSDEKVLNNAQENTEFIFIYIRKGNFHLHSSSIFHYSASAATRSIDQNLIIPITSFGVRALPLISLYQSLRHAHTFSRHTARQIDPGLEERSTPASWRADSTTQEVALRHGGWLNSRKWVDNFI